MAKVSAVAIIPSVVDVLFVTGSSYVLAVVVFPAVVSSLLLLAYPTVDGVPAVASDPVVAVPPALALFKYLTFWTVGLLDYDYQTIDYWTINLGKLSDYQYRTKESNFWTITYDLLEPGKTIDAQLCKL